MGAIFLFLAVAVGDCPHELGFINNVLFDPEGTQIEVSYRYSDSQTWIIAAVLPAAIRCFAHPPSDQKRCFRVRWLNPNSAYSREQCEIANPSGLTVVP